MSRLLIITILLLITAAVFSEATTAQEGKSDLRATSSSNGVAETDPPAVEPDGAEQRKPESEDDPTYQQARDQAYRFAYTKGKLPQGIELLEKSLAEIDKRYPNGHLETVLTCRDLATIHFYGKNFQKAVDYQQRSYDCCLKIYPEDGWPDGFISTVEATMLLGRFHLTNQQRDKFEQYMLRSVELLESAPMEPQSSDRQYACPSRNGLEATWSNRSGQRILLDRSQHRRGAD